MGLVDARLLDVGRSRKDLKKLRAAQQEAYLICLAPDGTFEAEAEDPTSPLDQAALPSDASDDDSPQGGRAAARAAARGAPATD
ncbi:hypothetical protein CYMTET_54688 [Cymbomonas tetramitiformis]|uniref:Uncharacterized protein n=1 Tax=Cymbomonas tetramitiformis TaxID=36881 RepID=A0AAE0BER1_9CHLO|nr:hypothetical protein CYMTET_54688 [Cymbomonas tetramitiformis]